MITFYVSPTGVNAAGTPGTLAAPWKTITYAVSRCAPSLTAGNAVTLLVRGGVYQEEVRISVGGTGPDARFTVKGFGGETVRIDGRANLTIADPDFGTTDAVAWNTGGRNRKLPIAPVAALRCSLRYPDRCFHSKGLLWVNADWVEVEGLNIGYSKGRGIQIGGNTATDRRGRVIVRNCTVDRAHANGLSVLYGSYVEVVGCDIQHSGDFAPYSRSGLEENWPGSFAINQSDHVEIHGNRVHDCQAEGILVNTDADFVKVYDNEIWNTYRDKLYVNRAHEVEIYNNVVYDTGDKVFFSGDDRSSGISVNNEDATAWAANCRNVKIHHNLVVNCKHNLLVQAGTQRKYPFTDVQIYNNTFVNAVQDGAEEARCCSIGGGDHRGDTFVRDNVFVQAGGPGVIASVSTALTGLAISRNAWSSLPPVKARGAGDVVGDVGMVAPNAPITKGAINPDNYRLRAGSPALGFGFGPPVIVPPVAVSYPGGAMRRGLRAGVRVGVG